MIGVAVNWGSFLLDMAKQLYPDSKEIGDAADVAGKVRRSYNVISTGSVHQSANKAVISPMVCIQSSLVQQEYMSDLMQIITIRDVVATLTHLALQGSVGVGVKIENVIGTINPNRAGMMALQGIEALDTSLKPLKKVSGAEANEEGDNGEKNPDTHIAPNGKSFSDINEYVPLAVGKTVMATIYTDSGKEILFPLTFREIPVPVTNKDLLRVFSAAKIEDGFFARLSMMKAGEITTPELISGKDIIKEKFRIKNEDMSGYYKEATKREQGNRAAALRTGLVSLNTLANSFIISKDFANELELELGRRLTDPRGREKIFHAVKANTIVVCNEDRGIFTFYTIGNDMPEEYTRKDLAVKSKKDTSSNNLADLVKLLNGGM